MIEPDRSWRTEVPRECGVDEGCSQVGRGSVEQYGRVLAFHNTARGAVAEQNGGWRSRMVR